MSLADSKKKKNANQEIRGFWNDFISCQTGMLQDDWVTLIKYENKKNPQIPDKAFINDYLISSKRATCCIEKEHFQMYLAVQFLVPKCKGKMNIPYPGKPRFRAIPSSYFTLSIQNQSLKLNTKKEVQKERNQKNGEHWFPNWTDF